jgi:hypothetical protein
LISKAIFIEEDLAVVALGLGAKAETLARAARATMTENISMWRWLLNYCEWNLSLISKIRVEVFGYKKM